MILHVLMIIKTLLIIEHIHGRKDSFLAKTQDVFNPVQQVVARGCHLDRDTDQLLASHVGGDLTRTSGRYFRALLEEQYLLLPYQWPISRQYFAVYQK